MEGHGRCGPDIRKGQRRLRPAASGSLNLASSRALVAALDLEAHALVRSHALETERTGDPVRWKTYSCPSSPVMKPKPRWGTTLLMVPATLSLRSLF